MMRAAQLQDADWLRERYLTSGDQAIATELGVHRKTVRLARRRHGIESAPPGRRPDAGWIPRSSSERTATVLIAERIAHEADAGPAGPAVVSDRIRAVHRARLAGDQLALEDALVSAATALALWLDQLRRVRASVPDDGG